MRILVANQIAALSAPDLKLHYLVECKFPADIGGDLLLCTAPYNLPYAGNEWIGTGAMLQLDLAQEDSSMEIHPATVTLNGLDATLLSMVLNEEIGGVIVHIWMALFDPETNQPVGPPVLMQKGRIGEVSIVASSSDEGGG